MALRKLEAEDLYRGVLVEQAYEGALLKVAPAQLAFGESPAERVLSCRFSLSRNVERRIRSRLLMDQANDKIRACLSLIVNQLFVVVPHQQKVNSRQLARKATVNFARPSTFGNFERFSVQRQEERQRLHRSVVLDEPAVRAWDQASSYLLSNTTVNNDDWLTTLQWLRHAANASINSDKLTYTWIGFSALFRQVRSQYEAHLASSGASGRVTEEGTMKYFAQERLDRGLCQRFVEKYKLHIQKLAKAEPMLTAHHSNPSKRRTEALSLALPQAKSQPEKVVVALLPVIYAVRNNIFHANWTYDEMVKAEGSVALAHRLLTHLLTRYFFLHTIGREPDWSLKRASDF